ncbi:bifunctional arginine demethylase and lysyl-hydroxylase JMJD6-A-like [Glandiceps talaboti]
MLRSVTMSKVRNGTSSEKDRQRDELIQKFVKLRKDAENEGLDAQKVKEILSCCIGKQAQERHTTSVFGRCTHSVKWVLRQFKSVYFISFFVPVLVGVFMMLYRADFQLDLFFEDVKATPCLVDTNFVVMEMTRPLVKCDMCMALDTAPVVENLSREEFMEKYAYSGVPVLVTGATVNWTAMDTFSFGFFKELYTGTDGALQNVEDECQFFPYNTEFVTLAEAFNMSDDRARFKENEKTWYIGWSNCHPKVSTVLREHYQRPYFLPEDSESSSLDWIFMGGSGQGANIHLDFVQRPSWQAQISGKKTWTLIPSPECEDVCKSMEITVNKGDIIIIDTNIWYHSTFIAPGEISITIGSEYD